MVRLSGALTFARSQSGMRSFFRDTIDLEDARRIVIDQLERREENFLSMLETKVFGYERSPYRPLFALAGIGFEDVRRELNAHGLETTLQMLREADVYVTFEEFKGRQPIARGGREFPVRWSDFANPHVTPTHHSLFLTDSEYKFS